MYTCIQLGCLSDTLDRRVVRHVPSGRVSHSNTITDAKNLAKRQPPFGKSSGSASSSLPLSPTRPSLFLFISLPSVYLSPLAPRRLSRSDKIKRVPRYSATNAMRNVTHGSLFRYLFTRVSTGFAIHLLA